jgi:hypothetical protein
MSGIVLALLAFLAAWASASAAAAPPSLLTRFPEKPAIGAGADQLNFPRALDTDPSTGAVDVVEEGNNRISQFTPWGEFIKAWGWGVEDGSAALQTCGPPEPVLAPDASLCQKGISGSGAGQMQRPNGIAIDSSGDVYVLEGINFRVQKFNAAGEFILMFGGDVDKTTSANICTKASGHECGVGVEGTGDGFFEPPLSFLGNYIAVGADGTVYVSDQDRIEMFEPDGTFKGQIKFSDLHSQDAEFPENGFPATLAFDAKSTDLYFSLLTGESTNPSIFKLDPVTGKLVGTPIEASAPNAGLIEALKTDSEGNVYVVFDPAARGSAELEPRVLEFGPSGEALIDFSADFAAPQTALTPSRAFKLLGLATNSAGDLYVAENSNGAATAAVSAYGPPPITLGPPPKRPPTITEQFAFSVDTTGATVKAKINPHFFADTTYYVEYGTSSCDTSSCTKQPVPPGSVLTKDVVDAPLATGGILLRELSPDTTYHYRFVAESEGGGPVKGLSGKAGEAGEATFTTYAPPVSQSPCPANQAFRPGPAAFLPDCRAYEMVSPVDKNGADISVVLNSHGDPTGLDQAAVDGERLTFSAYRAFGEVESSPYTSQYLATRTAGVGWSSQGISPPREGPSLYNGGPGLDSQYKGFSDDLCSGWVLQDSDISLAEGWVEGFPNVYRHDLCKGGYEALGPLKAPSLERASEFVPEVQGSSTDGSTTILLAKGRLTSDASTAFQLYEATGGQLRLACILPNETAIEGGCSAGTKSGALPDREGSLAHAISDDGQVIYWTAAANGAGPLYVRVSHDETTLISAGQAQFLAASADGSKAIYSVGSELFEFSLAAKSSKLIAKGFLGLLGASETAMRAYFVSSEVLAAGATSGKANLYLYEAGEPPGFSFVAALSADDLNGQLRPVATSPIDKTSQVTPDGGAVVFMSVSRPGLTGFDNTDANSGQADAEVYLYRAASKTLICVSCNPSGARPTGRDIASETNLIKPFWAAAQIPAAENQLHFPRVLSSDGTRAFFESFDPLALRDTNSQNDVYEWEAMGTGNCSEGAPGFRVSLEGCVNLISSGESAQDSEIVDTSPDGRDVFFKTESSLLPQDPGLVDIYDARVGGGFPLQEPPSPECQGEACQSAAPTPNDPTPSSQGFVGPPNQLQCPKGQHRVVKNGEQRCVKRRKHRRHKRHRTSKHQKHKSRRAGR